MCHVVLQNRVALVVSENQPSILKFSLMFQNQYFCQKNCQIEGVSALISTFTNLSMIVFEFRILYNFLIDIQKKCLFSINMIDGHF